MGRGGGRGGEREEVYQGANVAFLSRTQPDEVVDGPGELNGRSVVVKGVLGRPGK